MRVPKRLRLPPTDDATRDPLFILQSRRLVVVSEAWMYCSECEGYWQFEYGGEIGDGDVCRCFSSEDWSAQGISAAKVLEQDREAVVVYWEDELAFATREEAEAYGRSRAYNYEEGWRSYSIPAQGILSGHLKIVRGQEPGLASKVARWALGKLRRIRRWLARIW